MESTQLSRKDRHCLLLAGGDIASYSGVIERIPAGAFVLCADSGYKHCAPLSLVPDLIMGDLDSIENPPANVTTHKFPPEKDDTDTVIATKYAVENGYTHIMFAGILGGRFDHSLANIQNLAFCSRMGIVTTATDGVTDIYAITDCSVTLNPQAGYYFSVFSMSEVCSGVNIKGAKYLLSNHTLAFDSPRGVSNEFLHQPVQVSVEHGTLIIIVTG